MKVAPKVAIVHEWLDSYAGSERVVEQMLAVYPDADLFALVREFPNVVVTRTMSKAHALAGLRVGYALCPPGVAEVLHRVRDSYNVDRLAQVAAAAALDDREWLDVTVAQVRATRDRLAAAGRERAAMWSWDRAAQRLLECCE